MIVAEIGTNWNGDYTTLESMVKSCKEAGINFVKFQALDKKLVMRHEELTWYNEASVSEFNAEKINQICKYHKMEWFCTPCYPEAVNFLNPYVKMWKIRSGDNKRIDIIEKCLDTNKPVYISCSRPDEIILEHKNLHRVFCIPKYPTSFGEINFDMIKKMNGYSNHCKDSLAILRAKRLGAEYIEFHVMPNSDYFTIDNKVSFTLEQMKELMQWL